MTRLLVLFAFSLFLMPLNLFSQKEIYLDEGLQEINSNQFNKKCKSHLLKCFEYKTDSLIINKVLLKYSFGKISTQEYNQIRQILMLDSKNAIDSNSILVIKYIDTLRNYASLKKSYVNHYKMHSRDKIDTLFTFNGKSVTNEIKTKEYSLTKKQFHKNIYKYSKKQNKCLRKFEKINNADVFHVYKFDENIKNQYTNINWIKDRNVLKGKFFNIVYNYNFLILKPNGEYFLSGSHLSDKNVKILLKNTDWSTYKDDWYKSLTVNLSKGKGFFKKEDMFFHADHCF